MVNNFNGVCMTARINLRVSKYSNNKIYVISSLAIRNIDSIRMYLTRLIFVCPMLLVILISFPILAESKYIDNNYIKTDFLINRNIGLNSNNNKLNNSKLFSVAFGGNLISSNRIEVTYLHMQKEKYNSPTNNILLSDHLKSSISADVVFLSFYSDLDISDRFIPYFGLGVGLSKIKMNGDKTITISTQEILSKKVSVSQNSLAYQFGTGVNFVISDNLYLDLGYRYLHLGKIPFVGTRTSNIKNTKIHSHNLLFGLMYKF